jgi:hypothetical protein
MIADAGVAGNYVKLQRLERPLRSASLSIGNGRLQPAAAAKTSEGTAFDPNATVTNVRCRAALLRL